MCRGGQFVDGIADRIEGGNNILSFTELSSGAKISQIFHEQFPYEIARYGSGRNCVRKKHAGGSSACYSDGCMGIWERAHLELFESFTSSRDHI